jgi:hypothetical protein
MQYMDVNGSKISPLLYKKAKSTKNDLDLSEVAGI